MRSLWKQWQASEGCEKGKEAKVFDETQQILQFSMLIVQNTGCNSAVRSRVNDFMLIVQACV